MLLTGPVDTAFLAFGEVVGVDLTDGLMPLKLPTWVEESLATDSSSADRFVGQHILYKWAPRLGGWARGKVVAINTDKAKKVGKEVCNFLVHYPVDDDTSEHLFTTSEYAATAKAVPGSWVLFHPPEMSVPRVCERKTPQGRVPRAHVRRSGLLKVRGGRLVGWVWRAHHSLQLLSSRSSRIPIVGLKPAV